ncbi:hypothetical protein GCM10010497_45910 [Streptomyces cinereoruber]|uniref:DUF3040 domain-containing protein n=1 Tax=Streptomyces cinereoruber TaxID=67260 RepID=A0AAV4KN03_9ACTN|nr:hypothetical protein [Streptomyces cinereoruber]MBB4160060.1 hypothetical protein [Streptomyces cinereoruber]MBY8818329.1 hypothetical protein [Streptomyces cinereoruber]NIH60998.1 hypothetical protein [Streptomyces cinereoruber]QEV33287.1 hypothetical protein CP977_14845 [Streptomyces cinereoruber]GGR37852.1 hypothetical protein GCM10010497_45910 [Streptomyces cinereoruber]
MSDIEKAARDAVDAQANAEQVAMVLAILQAQQLTPQQPVQAPAPVQQQSPAKWVAVGVAAPFLAVSLAVGFVAVAVSAVAVTICVLVLRGLWIDMQKDRRR